MENKKILSILTLCFAMLFSLSSVYSADWYDPTCWFNDNPELGVYVSVYDESGVFKESHSITEISNNIITIIEGEQLKFDMGDTTDDENNIQQERIFWLHETRNDLGMNIQDTVSTVTTISTESFSSSKFDFYEYLNTGLYVPQYFQENSKLISSNSGNPQNHLVKAFKPNVGIYEVLFRVSDTCGDSDGSDEVYNFIDIVVEPKPIEYMIEANVDDFNRADTTSVGVANNGNSWAEAGSIYGIINQKITNDATGSGWIKLILDDNPNIIEFDTTFNNAPAGTFRFRINIRGAGTGHYINLLVPSSGNVYATYNNPQDTGLTWSDLGHIKLVSNYPSSDTFDVYNDNILVLDNVPYETGDVNTVDYFQLETANIGPIGTITVDNIQSSSTNPSINTCDGTFTIPTSGDIDIILNDGCTNIVSNNDGTINLFKGTIANDIEVNIDYNLLRRDTNINDDGLFISVTDVKSFPHTIINFNNYNGRFDVVSTQYTSDFVQLVNTGIGFIGTTSGSRSIDLQGNTNGILSALRVYISNSFNDLDLTLTNSGEVGGTDYYEGATYNNINFIAPSTTHYFNLNVDVDSEIKANVFTNMPPLILQEGASGKTSFNIFQFGTNTHFQESQMMLMSDFTLSKSYGSYYVGNAWLDSNGNDIYVCSGNTIERQLENKIYKVCDTPILIGTFEGMGTANVYDYIIVTENDFDPIDPPKDNKKPIAILSINNANEVEVGTEVCWDTSDSYDTDGTIISKTVWEDNVAYTSTNTRCITKNTPTIVDVTLEVEDNEGSTDTDSLSIKWFNVASVCEFNQPATLGVTATHYQDNLYYLNMTINDPENNPDIFTAWTVNGEIIEGENILTNINFNQDVYGSVFDGCNSTIESVYVDVGLNYSIPNPIEDIDVNLVCSRTNLFTPADINCEVIKDLKSDTLSNITWLFDNSVEVGNQGSTIFSRTVGDTSEHIIKVIVTTQEGQTESDYYRFNLITIIGDDDSGDSGGGGGGDSKIDCSIDYPSSISLDKENLIVPISFVNNEDGSWSPDYRFEDVLFHDSSLGKLSITNIIGTIQAGESKDIGVQYDYDINDNESINTQNKIVFTSSNCNDIEITVNVNINDEGNIIFEFFDDVPTLSQLNPLNLLEATIVEKEEIGENEIMDSIKVWHLSSLIAILLTIVMWKIKIYKPKGRKKFIKQNFVVKSIIIILLTSFITVLLLRGIRYLIS